MNAGKKEYSRTYKIGSSPDKTFEKDIAFDVLFYIIRFVSFFIIEITFIFGIFVMSFAI